MLRRAAVCCGEEVWRRGSLALASEWAASSIREKRLAAVAKGLRVSYEENVVS